MRYSAYGKIGKEKETRMLIGDVSADSPQRAYDMSLKKIAFLKGVSSLFVEIEFLKDEDGKQYGTAGFTRNLMK